VIFRKNLEYFLKWKRFLRLTQLGVVLFMYAKYIIMSDSNALSGSYRQYTSCSRPPDIFLVLSVAHTTTDKIPFRFMDSTGYREKEVTALR